MKKQLLLLAAVCTITLVTDYQVSNPLTAPFNDPIIEYSIDNPLTKPFNDPVIEYSVMPLIE